MSNDPPNHVLLESTGHGSSTPLILADGLQIAGGPWTLSILLTQSRTDFATNVVTAEEKVIVNLSWGLAKALSLVLGQALDAYEAGEDRIVLPKSFQEKFDAQVKSIRGE